MTTAACAGVGACKVDDSDPPGEEASGEARDGGDGDFRVVHEAEAVAEADAGRPPEGSPCTIAADGGGQVQAQSCGYCGTQSRLCADSTGSGATTWEAWGFCMDEVYGGCIPGSQGTAVCGKCGTQATQCSAACKWTNTGACTNEGVCWPGDIDFYLGLSCYVGDGRQRECDNTCLWNAFGKCETPPTSLTISDTIGGRVAERFTASPTPSLAYIYDGNFNSSPQYKCQSGYMYLGSTEYPYAYVEVKNPDPINTATVSLWVYPATGSWWSGANMYITTYATKPLDTDTSARETTCSWMVDTCYDTTIDPTACVSNTYPNYYGGLVKGEGRAITIKPNSSIWVYTYNQNEPPEAAGDFMLGVKTHALVHK